jgi:hypothetical protein
MGPKSGDQAAPSGSGYSSSSTATKIPKAQPPATPDIKEIINNHNSIAMEHRSYKESTERRLLEKESQIADLHRRFQAFSDLNTRAAALSAEQVRRCRQLGDHAAKVSIRKLDKALYTMAEFAKEFTETVDAITSNQRKFTKLQAKYPWTKADSSAGSLGLGSLDLEKVSEWLDDMCQKDEEEGEEGETAMDEDEIF